MKRIQKSMKQSIEEFQSSEEGIGGVESRGPCKLKPHLMIKEAVIQGTGCEITPFGECGWESQHLSSSTV